MAASKNKRREDQKASPYEALSFEGIESRANYRSVSYRIDMLHVLDKKDSAAIIYQIIYRWLEYRRDEILVEIERRQKDNLPDLTIEEVEGRMWIYMSYNDFVRETGGAISYNTVIAALEYLVTTKGVLKRRENSNPRYSDYEYSIEKEKVRELLKTLPEFPFFVAKGTKKGAASEQHSTNSGTVQSPKGSTNSGIGSTNSGTVSPKTGIGSTNSGTAPYQNWGTSQVAAQDSPQDSPQGPTQKQQPASDEQQQAAAAGAISLESLSQKEIELIWAYRQQTTGSPSTPLEKLPPPDELIVKTQQLGENSAINEERQAEVASDGVLTEEIIVQVFERLRGQAYEQVERQKELAAANAVLHLHLPVVLSVAWLERLYTTFNDAKFREWFGALEVHHLPGKESTGQIRCVRWLNRLLAQDEQKAKTSAARQGGASDPRQVEWEGQMVSLEEAHKRGYQGGFEKFRQSDNPDDDLEAAAALLAAEGKLATAATAAASGGRNE